MMYKGDILHRMLEIFCISGDLSQTREFVSVECIITSGMLEVV